LKGLIATIAVALALVVPVAASSKPSPIHGRPLGIVAPNYQISALGRLVGGTPPNDQCPVGQTPAACNLDYQGGSVMHSSTTYAIYWVPSGYHVSTNYETVINQYFADVAAASGHADNVHSVATQYHDATGTIGYQSTFGGSYVDTDVFPASGCNDHVHTTCLTDQQIQTELQTVLTTKGWHGTTSTIFFVMTPDSVGSCLDSIHNQCTTNTYCAYHNSFTDSSNEPVIYGNEPYDATIPGCNPGSSPNNDDADAAINTLSHEHNEAITDPFGDAWWNLASGQENGDNCAWIFGTALGGTPNVDAYNQVINGHHYWLQEEWSNDGSACAQRYPFAVPSNTAAPAVSGAEGEGRVLSATSGAWSQVPTSYAYQWLRCSTSSETSCFAFPGDTGATYQLTSADVGRILRAAVYATNAIGTSIPGVSAPTAAVAPVPTPTAVPIISGVAAAGKSLSVSTGTWNTPASFTYQWLSCSANGTGCVPVDGAIDNTYYLLGGDAGHTFEVVVTATNAAGTGQTLSKRSALVVGVPHLKKAPRISGRARVRGRLKVSKGTWIGPPRNYRYQWLLCNGHGGGCKSIHRATHPTFRTSVQDAGHRLRVRVTAANAAGKKTTTSGASARIAS
jgi:hypothetical protein